MQDVNNKSCKVVKFLRRQWTAGDSPSFILADQFIRACCSLSGVRKNQKIWLDEFISCGFRVSPVLTGVSRVGMRPYLNNRLDCGREGEEVNVGGRPHLGPLTRTTLMLTHACPCMCERTYPLPGRHPAPDGGNQDGAEEDLGGVVDQEWDWYQGQVLVALKHDFQHGDTWTKRKHVLQFYTLNIKPLNNYWNISFAKFCHLLADACTRI